MTSAAEPLVFNPFDPGFRSDPYPFFNRIREEDPGHVSPLGFHVLSRYDDCAAILKHPDVSSDQRNAADYEMWRASNPDAAAFTKRMEPRRPFLFMDPPDHSRLRALVSKSFTPKRVEGLRPRVQQLVDELVDAAVERGSLEVVEELAYPVPVVVICELLGVPLADHETFKGWSRALARSLDPDMVLPPDVQKERVEAITSFHEYFLDLIARLRRDPGPDLLSALVAAEDAGDKLTEDELLGICTLLLIAGHETTVNLIGNGVLALLRHRDQWERLTADPSLARSAVEEVLRFDPPVQFDGRVALADIELEHCTLKAGESPLLILGAANRDPRHFDDPDRFDIGRADNHHLAFGYGLHFCLGAPLARLEGQVALATLARRLPGMQLVDEHPPYKENVVLRGLAELRGLDLMAIGITDEHEALRSTARRWLESRCPNSVPRALLDVADDDPAAVALPPFWKELADQGWLGLHIPEEHGGSGYGLVELAVVLEELGRAGAPGPFLPSVLAAAVIAEGGDATQKVAWLPGLADGSVVATVGLATDGLEADDLTLSGTLRPVVCGGSASLIIVPLDAAVVVVSTDDDGVNVRPVESLDSTRRLSEVGLDAVRGQRLRGINAERVRDLAAAMFTAEAAGITGWCLDTTNAYAKLREQFGRPIGQFQAVKHRLADMLVMAEQARSVAWDASSAGDEPLPIAVAGALAFDNAVEAAKWCVQLHGGIGFTWEHDAHLYLKRALAVRQLLGGGGPWRARVARLALGGARRDLHLDLPPEAEATRDQVRADAQGAKAIGDATERRAFLADRGYLAPNWPSPYGRDAGPVEQLVIDEEFRRARVRMPHLSVGAWALPTIITHGTVEQQERFCGPTLRGEMNWCQMFSEPGAGSDLASLTTKAVKVDGGWSVSGQKVWTSMARDAQWAILLARTNPTAPKHNGITYFLLDMAADGIDIRPLRELTGVYWFNEIFLSDVFVPDDCVVGDIDDGWKLARTTLANERVSMGSGSSFGYGVEAVLDLVGGASADEPLVLDQLGALLAEAQSLALLGFRTTLRQLSGADPGPESSVRKLLGVEHEQRVQEFGLSLLGAEGATVEGVAGVWTNGFLANRCLTIAGGTSEVQRNVIAERLLGLPRDP